MDTCPVCHEENENDDKEVDQSKQELKKCAGCNKIAYCSSDHQKIHWRIHKKDCSPFKITIDPIFGKQCVATRDLNPGQILLEEYPVLYYPHWTGFNWVCLTCGLHFEKENPRLCSTCGWPICSTSCEQVPIHKDNECFVFYNQHTQFPPSSELYHWFGNKYGIRLDSETYTFITMAVMCIRGLRMKKLDPKSYKQLMNEFFNRDEKDGNSFIQCLDIHIAFFRKLINLEQLGIGEVERDELCQFAKVVNGNNFIYHQEDETIKRAKIGGAFIKSSRLNHSCSPNAASRVILKNLPFPVVKIRTITSVKKGDPLTMEYLHNGIESMNKRERQEIIFKKWSFRCQCRRCVDPTELSTFSEGVTCVNCRPLGSLIADGGEAHDDDGEYGVDDKKNLGYFVSVNPLDFNHNSEWKCNCCQTSKSYGAIHKLTTNLKEELERLAKKNVLGFLDLFVKKNSQSVLHPNHWILMEAATEILKMLAARQLTMSRNDFDKFMENHDYMLSNINMYAPGISGLRAHTLRQVSAWVVNTMRIIPEEFTKKEKISLLNRAMMYNDEAALYYAQDKDVVDSQKYLSDMLDYAKSVIEQMLRELSLYGDRTAAAEKY